jgi:hypothetical protein
MADRSCRLPPEMREAGSGVHMFPGRSILTTMLVRDMRLLVWGPAAGGRQAMCRGERSRGRHGPGCPLAGRNRGRERRAEIPSAPAQ